MSRSTPALTSPRQTRRGSSSQEGSECDECVIPDITETKDDVDDLLLSSTDRFKIQLADWTETTSCDLQSPGEGKSEGTTEDICNRDESEALKSLKNFLKLIYTTSRKTMDISQLRYCTKSGSPLFVSRNTPYSMIEGHVIDGPERGRDLSNLQVMTYSRCVEQTVQQA